MNLLANATSASYTPPSPTLADHRAQFTCIVSNYGGTTTTSAATLSVFATGIEVWQFDFFGTNANAGSAADDADPDSDGLKNIIEYALGSNPLLSNAAAAPVAAISGGSLSMNITQPADVGGVTYGAEWSANFLDWYPISDAGSGAQHSFAAPIAGNPQLFMRFKVTRP